MYCFLRYVWQELGKIHDALVRDPHLVCLFGCGKMVCTFPSATAAHCGTVTSGASVKR